MSDGPRDDRLVKADQLSETVRPMLAHTGDVRLPAAVHRALLEADTIVRAARDDAAAIREAARQEGLARALEQAVGLLRGAEQARLGAVRAARDDIAVLAVAAASKLLGRRLSEEPEVMADLVEQALGEAAAARRVRVVVAALPEPALEAARARLAGRGEEASIVLEVDPSLHPGDCVIETERGRVDARLELQFETLLRALLAGESA